MQTLDWYLNRLGRMSAAEIAWRAGRLARTVTDRLSIASATPVRVPQPALRTPQFVHLPHGLLVALYEERVAPILRFGEYRIFELDSAALGTPPDWNRDPSTGRLAPLTRAAALDYRDEHLVGDIKYLWEPNRHLHIVHLAQAYALTGKSMYLREIERQIDSWIVQCPVGLGANWTSALELAIRLINWSLTWQLVGGERSALFLGAQGRELRARWLQSIHSHAKRIVSHFSRFSSANNHLIGEAAGVWIAAATWPHLRQLRTWGARCRTLLEQEVLKQNAPDGGNREQALAYQQFVLDFFVLSGLAARAAGTDFSPAYWQRIETMIEFLASVIDVGGNVPMIGDADDGYVTTLAAEPDFCPYRSLVATGAVLFGRRDFAAKARTCDAKTRWLLGDAAQDIFRDLQEVRYEPKRAFPESGYYLLGDRLETLEEVRLLVDAGPLGYLSLAAHGHADALSVLLSVGGHEVLVDPGTYAYHTQQDWRRYFRSTQAHNTVTVDGADQSQQSGNFMWSRHARAQCLRFDVESDKQTFCGEHDGYLALEDPVKHRRTISYDPRSRTFEIEDAFECRGPHPISRRWHFAEHLTPIATAGIIKVQVGPFTVTIESEPLPLDSTVFRGGSPQEGGWVSRGFGRKVPSSTVVWNSTIPSATSLKTSIRIRS